MMEDSELDGKLRAMPGLEGEQEDMDLPFQQEEQEPEADFVGMDDALTIFADEEEDQDMDDGYSPTPGQEGASG